MRITQGTFSYLPDFTDDEIAAQIGYAQARGWAVAVEFTDDPHPRNVLWEMWGLPMFGLDRQESAGRQVRYKLHPYAADRPRGDRYAAGSSEQNGARSG